MVLLFLQIGHRHVVDATLQEEACSLASVLVAINIKGTLTCMRKMGKGSLDPECIFEMIEVKTLLTNHTAKCRHASAECCFFMHKVELAYSKLCFS